MSPDLRRLRDIHTLRELIPYLRDELNWPIDQDAVEDDVTFEWTAADLGIEEKHAVKITKIMQLRPLKTGQPWGIFFVNFEKKRLPVVVMRKLLSGLAVKKRVSAGKASQAAWKSRDLLFISAYGEDDKREISFAHFSEDPESPGDIPTLRVLGWDDDDTGLKLDYVAQRLKSHLAWPPDEKDLEAWRRQWASAFVLRNREVINTSSDLALHLADLARRIRHRANQVMKVESERGTLRKLHTAFKQALIHDLTEDAFADMYAQTITYGLFSSAVSRPAGVSADTAVQMVPVTNPFLKELLQAFLTAGGRKDKLDFDELGIQEVVELLNSPDTHMDAVLRDFGNRNPDEDPVIHFYEHFLAAYDKQLKVQRGVFYTPKPVVSYIVRSVHELLQTEFGLEDGLASTVTWGEMLKRHKNLKLPPLTDEPGEKRTISPDEPFVQILDPATGTATFPVEVIDVIHKHLEAKWNRSGLSAMPLLPGTRNLKPDTFNAYWNLYVPLALLPRLHAYELMMAPYAIAHMKIGLKLAETGYRFGAEERARIYLTNALEPWVKQLPLIGFDALAHEAAAVNEIKRHKRFAVVIGNPPYSIFSANMSEPARAIVDQYRYVDGVRIRERGALKSEVILQDDYVKFLGFAQNTIRATGIGGVGMITNSNCYQNPVLRGVRHSLQREFQVIHALDLGGQSKAGIDEDENVFDIDTSVAVSLMVQRPNATQYRGIARVTGSRRSKYEKLLGSTSLVLCRTQFNPKPEQFLFLSFASAFGDEYDNGFPIDRAFGVTSIGIKTARDHLVLDFEKAAVAERLEALRSPKFTAAELRERFAISDNTQWKFSEALPEFRKTFRESHYAEVEARPFDRRWLYFHPSLVFNTRPGINRHIHGRKNLCLLAMRRIRTETYAHFFVVSRIGMGEIISSADNCNFFPLYLYHDDPLNPNGGREPNLSCEFLAALAGRLGAKMGAAYSPEDIFHYAYAVFHSPGYRSRYAEFLKIDFPRLPLTSSLDLFRALAKLGGELVALHLMEFEVGGRGTKETPAYRAQAEYAGPAKPEVEKVSWTEETVWLDKAQSYGFRKVPEAVWNFHIGGYQVCEKWLKDRKGRTLTKDDLAHYEKITVALRETIRLMAEIDNVINQHGGWPGAFTARKQATGAAPPQLSETRGVDA